MPFVQRAVGPVHLSRVKLHDERGVPTVRDRELDAVTNFALSNALRQMASVAALADEVFRELRDQLTNVATRSAMLQHRVQILGHLVDHADPKAVTVRKCLPFFSRATGSAGNRILGPAGVFSLFLYFFFFPEKRSSGWSR